MNKGYEGRRFSLSTGADVRNSSYVWYEDMMRDRYSVKTHLEKRTQAARKKLIKKYIQKVRIFSHFLKQLNKKKTQKV